MDALETLNIDDVRAAAERITPYVCHTPVVTSSALDERTGARLHFKCEQLQHSGAFKFRGACSVIWALSDEKAARGVVTHSSGNHGTAVALAAATRGIPAHIVMPEGAVSTKIENVRRAGGVIHLAAPTQPAREEACLRIQRETRATLIQPFANRYIAAGQGTAVLELAREVPDLDVVLVPIGGGGLAAGGTVALAALAPAARLIGAEPAGADDAFRSMQARRRVTDVVPDTVCDGLRGTIGAPNFAVLQQYKVEIITVDDAATLSAMRLLWLELKQTVEPSSAIVMAALLAHPERFRGRRIGLVLTGGNVDLDHIPFLAGTGEGAVTG